MGTSTRTAADKGQHVYATHIYLNRFFYFTSRIYLFLISNQFTQRQKFCPYLPTNIALSLSFFLLGTQMVKFENYKGFLIFFFFNK